MSSAQLSRKQNPFIPEHDEKPDLSAYVQDAPSDDGIYARKNGVWVRLDTEDVGRGDWQYAFNASLDWQSFDIQYRTLAFGDLLQVYIPRAVSLSPLEPGRDKYFGNLPEGFRPALEQDKIVPAMSENGELDYVVVSFGSNGNISFLSRANLKILTVSETIMLT
ncbi:MAG TPA: hypothetical protein VNZ45_01680 [Bacteroidia bacterium]|jgi:hypothetical protein|nr:hypothetical protein [Bacteroidia bacterium]